MVPREDSQFLTRHFTWWGHDRAFLILTGPFFTRNYKEG